MQTIYVLTIDTDEPETLVIAASSDLKRLKEHAAAYHASTPLAETTDWPGWTDEGKEYFSAQVADEEWFIRPVIEV